MVHALILKHNVLKVAALVSPRHEANRDNRQGTMSVDENGVQKQNLDTEPNPRFSNVIIRVTDTSETT